MADTTLLWHDYETWGLNPRVDRPSQFAAIRTDTDLNIIGEPIELFCKPALDFIPNPESMLITHLTPQVAQAKGVNEAEFIKGIHEAFSVPGTCGVGYNSIRFDDEVTRFNLYRNFYDPYAREWQNGNSRWDIVDLVRMCYALRPDGIVWPEREPGVPSFQLEKLSIANGIEHAKAHDALSDVYATLGMAKVIKQAQPKLYEYYFKFRTKHAAAELLNLVEKPAVLHISGMYPSTEGCIAPVMPLCTHPRNKNEIILFDLRQNPHALFNTPPEEIAEHLFTRKADLPEGLVRVALKGAHINKSPALSPMSTLTPELAEKWGFDLKQIEANRQRILFYDGLEQKVQQIYKPKEGGFGKSDPDGALYGGFITRPDRAVCDQLLKRDADTLLDWAPPFQDERLQTIYPRYLARNWPDDLNPEQKATWQTYRAEKIIDGDHDCLLTLDAFFELMAQIEPENEEQVALLTDLEQWVETHFSDLNDT